MLNKIVWKNINAIESIAHFVSAQDNQIIYLKKWRTKQRNDEELKPEKLIFLFHDLGQYHGRFEHLIDWFQNKEDNFTFIAMDFVGHGLSSGTRGHFDQLDFLVKDIFYLLDSEIKNNMDQWYILAHGLGGLIVLDLMHKYPSSFEKKIDGLMLSNFIFDFEKRNFSKWIPESISPFVARMRLLKIYDGIQVANERGEENFFEQDPLIIHRPTWASLVAIKQKYKNVYRDAYFLDWPILVLKSGNDKYLLPSGMDFFVMGIKKNLLTEKHYSKLKHDLYNGNNNVMVFNDLLEWINTHEKIF